MLAAFLSTLLLTPILSFIHMVCIRAPYMSYMSYMSYYDIYDIWHLACIFMSIWVSKEALGPQEYSQPSYIFYKIVFTGQKLKYPDSSFFLCIFRIFFLYFTEFVGGLNIVQIKKEKFVLNLCLMVYII